MSELTVLQGVRLKGRVSEEGLAATLGEDPADIAETLAQLTAAGLLVEGKTLRISPEGRERLNALLAEERSGVDQSVLAKAYDEFRAVNNEFKALVSDWQIKDGQPNSHDDPEYDGAVLKRLDNVHQQVSPIVATVTELLPRLSAYSYHTVWFELHEELIVASGLTREEEARAGHAT